MSAYTFREQADKWLETASKFYLQDLEAIPEEKLGISPAGQARTPYDFTYEVALVNNRVANDISGQPNEPWPFPDDTWAVAPEELRSKAAITDFLRQSIDNIKAAYADKTEEELSARMRPEGRETDTCHADRIMFAAYHTGYHGAQLNYIQSIYNDLEVHWS